jgi:hypothetical protein
MNTIISYRRNVLRQLTTGLLATVWLAGCAATPKQAAKDATEGALEEASKPTAGPDGGAPSAETLAANIVKGVTSELDKPETRGQIGRVVEIATRSAIGSVVGELSAPQWTSQHWADSEHGFQLPSTASPSRPNTAAALGGPAWAGQMSPVVGLSGRMAEGFTLGMSRQLQIELGPNGQGPLGQTMASVLKEATQAAISGATQELLPADCAGLDGRACAERRARDLSRSAAMGFIDGLGLAIQLPLLAGAFVAGLVGALIVFLLLRTRRTVVMTTSGADVPRVNFRDDAHHPLS